MNHRPTTSSDTENDLELQEDAIQPLLSSSGSQSSSAESVKYNLTTEIHLPKPTKRKPSKRSVNNIHRNRKCPIFIKLNLIAKLFDYRRSYRDRWGRIRLGAITFSFFAIIYLCYLTTGENRTPEWIVNVPSIDESLPAPIGVFIFN